MTAIQSTHTPADSIARWLWEKCPNLPNYKRLSETECTTGCPVDEQHLCNFTFDLDDNLTAYCDGPCNQVEILIALDSIDLTKDAIAKTMSILGANEHLSNSHAQNSSLAMSTLDDTDEHLSENARDSGRINLASVRPEVVTWLWEGRIPLGKLTIVDGEPDTKKSTMLLDIAARLATGRPMPLESQPTERAAVLLLSAEDGLEDTIAPRLIVAGADMTMIEARCTVGDGDSKRMPEIGLDIALLENDIMSIGAKLVIIDPLVVYLGEKVNSDKDQQVRRALAPLAAVAERTGAAIVSIRHLNKQEGGKAINRGGGSIGIIGAARSGLLVAHDPDDTTGTRSILASAKCNLAIKPSSLAYRVVPAEYGVARIEWEGITNHTANSLVATPIEFARPAMGEATNFLRDLLADGPKPTDDVTNEARSAGISDATLRRARQSLGVRSVKAGFGNDGYWTLVLPE